MKISKEWIKDEEACWGGKKFFLKHFPEGEAELKSVVSSLLEGRYTEHLHWLDEKSRSCGFFREFTQAFTESLTELVIPEELNQTDTNVCSVEPDARVSISGNLIKVVSGGRDSQIGVRSDSSDILSSGDQSQIGVIGHNSRVSSSGVFSQIHVIGDYIRIQSVGDNSRISCIGDYARVNCGATAAVVSVDGERAVLNLLPTSRFKVGNNSSVSVMYSDGEVVRFAQGYTGENLKADVWYTFGLSGEFKEEF